MIQRYSRYADFYRARYADYSQTHRELWAGGPSLLKVRDRPAGHYVEPDIGEVTLQICTRSAGGYARLDLNAGRFPVPQRRGSFVVAPAGAPCVYDIVSSIDLTVLPFDAAMVVDVTNGSSSFERLHAVASDDTIILTLVQTLWDASPDGDRLLADHLRMSILARLAAGVEPSPKPPAAGLSRHIVRQIVDLLSADLSVPVPLNTMAGTAALSPFHFSRAFKAATGVPPHRYVVQLRIEKARERLEKTNLPIIEIAAQVGYDDPSYFARLFRREVGVTPAAYRRERRR